MPENGLIPIQQATVDDVFICGYPRSGHTWFQNLAAGVVFGIDPEYAHDSLVQDLVPDVHYKRFYKRYGPTAYFKSHHLPRPDYRRVVYLLRDGRDVMVSYWHFLSALRGTIDFLRLVQGEGLSPCHWHEHVERWTANPHRAEMMIVRYEELTADPVAVLDGFCAFARIERERTHLERIAAKAAFGKAQIKEQQQGWDNAAWPREHAFIRRGAVGSHQDEMPPEVRAAFMQRAAPTLTRLGYA